MITANISYYSLSGISISQLQNSVKNLDEHNSPFTLYITTVIYVAISHLHPTIVIIVIAFKK